MIIEKRIVVALLLLTSQILTVTDKYTITIAENGIDTLNWEQLGALSHEVIMGRSEFTVEDMNQDVYNSMLKKVKNPFLFRFENSNGIFRSVVKFDEDTKSFGFVVYTDEEHEVTAINVVKSSSETMVFAKSEKGRISYSKSSGFKETGLTDDDEDIEEEEDELREEEDEEIRLKRNRRKRKRKRKKRKKEEESFIKKNFWWLVIGGMIAYNVMTFDKEKMNKMMEEAQKKQRLAQQAQTQRAQGGVQNK